MLTRKFPQLRQGKFEHYDGGVMEPPSKELWLSFLNVWEKQIEWSLQKWVFSYCFSNDKKILSLGESKHCAASHNRKGCLLLDSEIVPEFTGWKTELFSQAWFGIRVWWNTGQLRQKISSQKPLAWQTTQDLTGSKESKDRQLESAQKAWCWMKYFKISPINWYISILGQTYGSIRMWEYILKVNHAQSTICS